MLQLDISDIGLQDTGGAILRLKQEMRLHPPRILMLQGPVGPFFKKLQRFLIRYHCDVWRVCFNSGDRFFSIRSNRLNFAGSPQQWQQWLERVLAEKMFDVIILFGSERPLHKTARSLAQQYGVRVISLEEGYVRPGFITVEEKGNNSCSPIAQSIPEVVYSTVNNKKNVQNFNGSTYQGLYSAIYYGLRGLKKAEHPALRHREVRLFAEAFYWVRNSYRRFFGFDTNFTIIQTLLETWEKKYFIVALQVSSDCNLQDAALGWNTQRLITETMRSFACSAPDDARLVFKIHPRERGRNNHAKAIHKLALQYGIADRVDVLDAGSMGLLTKHSAGMITINSTSGLSAIFHGVPLLVVGKALYSNSVLATCSFGKPDFDSFWRSRWVAPVEVRRSYIAWIKRLALKRGDFYSPDGMAMACEAVSDKIYNESALPVKSLGHAPSALGKKVNVVTGVIS